MRLKGNLTVRPDTGTINTSPITTATPILRLQHGCNHTFVIPGKITQILKSVQLMLFVLFLLSTYICDRLRENRAQRGVRKYREKIDRFLKNVLFQADGRERLGLL